MSSGQFEQRIEVGRLAVEMRREDRSGAAGDRRFDTRRIEVERARIGVDEYGSGADAADSQDGRDVAVAGEDHFVPGTDVHRFQ